MLERRYLQICMDRARNVFGGASQYGGEFSPGPRRPAIKLLKYPASTRRALRESCAVGFPELSDGDQSMLPSATKRRTLSAIAQCSGRFAWHSFD